MSESKASFTFGSSFQDDMLALMLQDLSFTAKAIKFVPIERLWSDAHKYLFLAIKERFERDGKVPSYTEIETDLRRVEKHKRRMFIRFCKEIYAIKSIDQDFIRENLTEYARKNAFIDIFQSAQVLWNEKKHDEAYNYTHEGMNDLYSISFKEDAGIPVADFETIRQQYLFDIARGGQKFPTKIPVLDQILEGGLEKGELGILLAEPKRGKSIGLVHMGCAALMMRSGRIVHFVLEGTTEQTVLRYQSRLSGIEFSRLKSDDITDEEQAKLNDISEKYLDNLELIPFNKHWSYTVLDIESKIKELQRTKRGVDLVIVDYADLLKASQKGMEIRHEQTEVYRDLKRLAMIHKVALWTASQARRPNADSDKDNYLLRARDIAENYEKVRIADIVATLNQTREEKLLGILRFYIDIYRSNDCDEGARLLCNFERMIFYSPLFGSLPLAETIRDWKKKGRKTKKDEE